MRPASTRRDQRAAGSGRRASLRLASSGDQFQRTSVEIDDHRGIYDAVWFALPPSLCVLNGFAYQFGLSVWFDFDLFDNSSLL